MQVNHQVTSLLRLLLIDEMVEFHDIGKEETHDTGEDEEGVSVEIGLGKVVRNADDGFTKHQDNQGGQPFQ